jgi:uncharacterized protein (TIGR03000 family)
VVHPADHKPKKKDKDDDDDDDKKKDKKPDLPKPKKDKDVIGILEITAARGTAVTVDGQPITLAGTTDTFDTPELEKGATYVYTIEARLSRDGHTAARTEQVRVKAGQTTRLDFRELAAQIDNAARARVTINVPENARVYVNDRPLALASGTHTINTPPLEKGKPHTYVFKAEVTRNGETVADTQRIFVESGQSVTVQFNLPAVAAAQR